MAHAITLEATLSFLGIGLPITKPSLGLLIANGYHYLLSGMFWISFYPGAALVLTIVSINLVGDQLRDIFNPRLKTMTGEPTLSVKNLKTHFLTRAGVVKAVDGVSFSGRSGRGARSGRGVRIGQVGDRLFHYGAYRSARAGSPAAVFFFMARI